eukprot:8346622-Pyramimonas_sp.AAC.1
MGCFRCRALQRHAVRAHGRGQAGFLWGHSPVEKSSEASGYTDTVAPIGALASIVGRGGLGQLPRWG